MTTLAGTQVAELIIGAWYYRGNGDLFEIVAIDDQAATIELQHFDGTLDEIDIDVWPTLRIVRTAAPEDWTGSMDMDPDDGTATENGEKPLGWHDPLEVLDEAN